MKTSLDPNAGNIDTDLRITFYERRFYVFSNFSAFQVFYKDRLWPTSEHAYQAMKFEDYHTQELVRDMWSAHDAMLYARENVDYARKDWPHVKLKIMKEICRAKMQQHHYIQKKIVESGNRELIETSPVDSYWGWGANQDGQNQLGRIWMELRDEWNAYLKNLNKGNLPEN